MGASGQAGAVRLWLVIVLAMEDEDNVVLVLILGPDLSHILGVCACKGMGLLVLFLPWVMEMLVLHMFRRT